VHETELPQSQNDQAVDVDLVPGVRQIGVAREAVVVVVQTLAEGEERDYGDSALNRPTNLD
jgi:hypothetical protein